jgi:hypothetical protein|tara:strand:+ start:2047 stop:2598 length:552 start_codon:yes stop_codon:yes gene_type:complete
MGNKTTKKEFAPVIAVLFIAFNIKPERETVAVWYDALKDIPIEILKSGTERMIAQHEGYLYIATLRKFCGTEIEVPPESVILADIRRAVSSYGIYENPSFEHQISHAVAEDIGWVPLCNSLEEELGDKVHWKYKAIAEEFMNCVKTGEEFRLSELKGLFELQGRGEAGKLSEFIVVPEEEDWS